MKTFIGELSEGIKRDFGSYSNMVELISKAAGSVEGSGWAWLGYRKELDQMEIACCKNQDPLWPTHGFFFILETFIYESSFLNLLI